MKLSETNDEQRKLHLDYIENRWSQLQELTVERAVEAWKYLMLTNSGSAIAVLSFMGANKTLTPIPGAPWMLSAFILGVIFVGFGHAVGYYRANWLFEHWRNEVENYFSEKVTWDELIERDRHRTKYFIWADIIGWASFICFLAGLGIGIVNLSKI
jgi:hypothetical protein